MTTSAAGFAAGLVLGTALGSGALATRSTAAGAPGAPAQAAKSQSASRIVLENDRVRVKDVTFPPGVTGMHTHDLPHVGIVIDGGTLEFRYPDGTVETATLEPGGVGFREAKVTHEPVNPGKRAVRVIEVELK